MYKVVHGLSVAFSYVGGVAILLMTGVTLFDIIARNAFGFAVFGTYDLVLITLVVSVFAGMAEAFRQKAHITVDLIDGLPGKLLRRVIGTAALTITCFTILFLTWLCIGQAIEAYHFKDVTTDLRIPKYLFWIGIIIGIGLTGITVTLQLIQGLLSGVAPQDYDKLTEEKST